MTRIQCATSVGAPMAVPTFAPVLPPPLFASTFRRFGGSQFADRRRTMTPSNKPSTPMELWKRPSMPHLAAPLGIPTPAHSMIALCMLIIPLPLWVGMTVSLLTISSHPHRGRGCHLHFYNQYHEQRADWYAHHRRAGLYDYPGYWEWCFQSRNKYRQCRCHGEQWERDRLR